MDKDKKKFTFVLIDGQTVNKFGKNIEITSEGVYFKEDKHFLPKEDILGIFEVDLKDDEIKNAVDGN